MKINEEEIFVLTNPLFWIWVILLFIYQLIKKAIVFTGINDWYFVLFNFDTMPEEGKKQMLFMMNNRTTYLFWSKRKAWEYAVNKINKEVII